MQLRLEPLNIKRERNNYPQVNYIDDNNVQWIEINRGCKRHCAFCHADPNYKVFDIPEIKRNNVHVVGEGFLYDPDIEQKIIKLGQKRVNDRVVYYGLSQGIDFRLLTPEIAELLSKNRFGLINNKGVWKKGIRFAWDLSLFQEKLAKETIDLLCKYKYIRKYIIVFVLINWKISYEDCLYKLKKLKEWGVRIDDCTWDTTKKEKLPLYWTKDQLIYFRKISRKHNQLIFFDGYDPENEN